MIAASDRTGTPAGQSRRSRARSSSRKMTRATIATATEANRAVSASVRSRPTGGGVVRLRCRPLRPGPGPATPPPWWSGSSPAVRGPDVVDVGCGTGVAARQFQAAGCRVLGVEPDLRMAELARQTGVDVEVASAIRSSGGSTGSAHTPGTSGLTSCQRMAATPGSTSQTGTAAHRHRDRRRRAGRQLHDGVHHGRGDCGAHRRLTRPRPTTRRARGSLTGREPTGRRTRAVDSRRPDRALAGTWLEACAP